MTDRIAEIRERAKVTLDEMRRACKRTPPIITMSIPAELERDLDILVDQLCGTDIPYLLAQLDAARAEVERLRAVVDKLPKTVDGVPVGPSERVFTLYGAEWFVQDNERAAEVLECGDPSELISNCYSTREAAEAARVPGPTQEPRP